MSTHKFHYSLEDKVNLKDIGHDAVIIGIVVYLKNVVEYKVSYWSEGTRKTEWVRSDEIEVKV